MKFVMRRRVLVAIVAGTAALALAGCSAPAPEPVKLSGSLTIWADGSEVPAMKSLADSFTSQYGVTVDVQEVSFTEIRDKFVQAAPAGEGPDLIVGAHDMLGSVVSSGLLEPIDLSEKATQGFVPSALSAFNYDGKLYGVPYASEALAMYVNTDLVPEAPKTWDDFMATAKQVQDSGKAKYGTVMLDNNPYYSYPIVTAFGGYVFGQSNGTYDPTDLGLDNPGSIAAAQAISQAVSDGLLVKGIDYETMQNLFKDGQLAMMIDGPWSLAAVEATGVPFTVTLIPEATQAARPFIGVRGVMESSFSQNKLAANVFLNDFLSTESAMELLNADQKTSSAWESLNSSPSDPLLKNFAASAANGDPTPSIPQMQVVWDRWGKAMSSLLAGEGDPAEVMKAAASDIRQQIK